MPELPEVETTRRGLAPHCVGRRIEDVLVRERRLRWPVVESLAATLRGQRLNALERRAKYLLFRFDAGTLLVHLGMSGSLSVLPAPRAPRKHDHVDLLFGGGTCVRYHDPRRFGSFQWFATGETVSPLNRLGPEPLDGRFDGGHLFRLSRGRRVAVKSFVMDGAVVVGVGNIYATEALFMAGIRPDRAAGRIARPRYDALALSVKQVLTSAIDQGGTTLRDFIGGDGRPGYFAQRLHVYGRAGQPCGRCGAVLRARVIGQRASVYCVACQR